jgi:hypothetical protein
MRESRFELSIGESVWIDDRILTIVDIAGDEITFRVDSADGYEAGHVSCSSEVEKPLVPR